ncbi:hypothetical protein ISCGN_032914 [Ixodes scapularis]
MSFVVNVIRVVRVARVYVNRQNILRSQELIVTYACATGGIHSLSSNTKPPYGSAGNGALEAATSEPRRQISKQTPQTRRRSSAQKGDAEYKCASAGEALEWTSIFRAAANVDFAILGNIEATWARTVGDSANYDSSSWGTSAGL